MWDLRWRSETDLDPRLIRQWSVGPVQAVAWWPGDPGPMFAAGVDEPLGDGEVRYMLLLGDATTGQFRVLASNNAVSDLVFAPTADGPVLISGHHGELRVWNASDGSLLSTIPRGGRDLAVIQVGGRSQVVSTHGHWWLPSGTPAGPGPVMLRVHEGTLSRWDLGRGVRAPAVVPPGLGPIVRAVPSVIGGREVVTVVDETAALTTFDPATGELLAPPVQAHRGGRLMLPHTRRLGSTEVAVVGEVVAVSTRWRVHLWDATTARAAGPPLTGPVAAAMLAVARWEGRDLLLTGSEDDGVIGLWDLGVPVRRAPGHGQRIVAVTRADPTGVVVSADPDGTLVARHELDGRLVREPLATGVDSTQCVAAWADGGAIRAATGGGTAEVRDPWLRRFDFATGERLEPDLDLGSRFVRHLLRADLNGIPILVTLSQGPTLRAIRAADGLLLSETKIEARSGVSGFAVSGAAVVLSTWYHPMTVFGLDDLNAAPITMGDAGDDAVLAVDGTRIVARRHDEGEGVRPGHVVRVWDTAGRPVTPGIRRPAPITHAAVRAWPAAYLAHADRTVTLTDLVTGQDAGEPLRLSLVPAGLAVTADGDLLVGAGSDVMRYQLRA